MSVGVKIVFLVGHDKTLYNDYKHIDEKIDSHITENLKSLSAFGSIF